MLGQTSAGEAPPAPRRRKRSSTRLAAAVLEMAPEATIVTDMAGMIRLVNHQAEVLFGYQRRELLGQSVELLLPKYPRTLHQQGRAASTPAHSPPLGIPVPFLGRQHDGREFPVEITFARLEQDDETFIIASVREARGIESAQAANHQLQRVLAVTDTALAHLEFDDLLPALLDRVLEVLAVDRASLHLLDTTGRVLHTRGARGIGVAAASATLPIPVGQGLAGRIAAIRQPLIVEDLSIFPIINAFLLKGLRSAMGVPLLLHERLVGVLTVSTSAFHTFTQEDVQLLERVAARITLAIERAQLFAAEQHARHDAERERVRWHTAMESVPECVITCDADLRITYVNPAYARLRGAFADPTVPAAERPSRYGLFLPDGQTLFPTEQLPLRRALREGRPIHGVQMAVRPPQGEERLVEWDAAPKYSTLGEMLGAVAVGHDITERTQMEREREQARAKAERHAAQLEATFEAMTDGVAVFDAQGQLVRENAAHRRLLGADAAFPDYAMLPLPERMALFAARDAQGRALGLDEGPLPRALHGEVAGGVETMDIRSSTLDGREVELNVSAAPLRDHDGQVTGAVAVFRDQTERNHLQRRTQELAAQLQATLDTMSDAVFLYDTDGQVRQLNAAAQALVVALPAGPPVSGSGTVWRERVESSHPRRPDGSPLPPEERPLARVLRGEVLTAAEAQDVVMTDALGRELVLNYRGGPARDEAGQLIGYVFVVRDVTERRRLQREREEALVASEVWFHTLADTAPVLVWVSGPDGLVTFVNLPWLQFTGRTLAQELGDGWAEGVHPDDYDRCLQTYRTAFQARERFTMEYRMRRADGEYRWLVDTGVPRFAPDGTFLGYIGSVVDISERHQLEQEREEARAQAERRAEELDRVFEAMADGVAVYDQDGRMVRANAALQHLLRLDAAPPDFAQLSLPERMVLFAIRDAHGHTLAPDEGPLVRALSGEALAGAEAMEGRLRTLDGRELELRVSAAPLWSQTGQLVGAVMVYHDQTESKRLEREVAEQAEQLDRIVEGIGEGLFVYDSEGNVVRTNAAARWLLGLGAAPHDFSALTAEARLALYTPGAGQQRPLPAPGEWLAARVLASGDGDVLSEPEARDIRLRALDGRDLEVSASMAPLRNPDGQVVGGVLLLSDRTERNELLREREEGRARELAAQELVEQLDQFFAMAAHDIRSPLTALSGSVQNAARRLQRLEAIQQARKAAAAVGAQDNDLANDLTTLVAAALDIAQTSAQNLVRLVNRLFDVARARSGALTLDLAELDLAALVAEQVATHQVAVSGSRLELHLPDQPVPVVGDAVRLGQVVTNYLANALKYSADDQPVIIRLSITGHDARLAVEDRGAGLSPEQQTHVWDLYHRAPNVRQKHQSASVNLEGQGVGLGLGLYIVKRLVELHPDGQVGVDSVVGKGSTFWFTLPLAISDEAL